MHCGWSASQTSAEENYLLFFYSEWVQTRRPRLTIRYLRILPVRRAMHRTTEMKSCREPCMFVTKRGGKFLQNGSRGGLRFYRIAQRSLVEEQAGYNWRRTWFR